MTADQLLDRLFRVLKDAVRENPALALQIEDALSAASSPSRLPKAPAPKPADLPDLNPFAEFKANPEGLRAKLLALDAAALKALNKHWVLVPKITARKADTIAEQIFVALRARISQNQAFTGE